MGVCAGETLSIWGEFAVKNCPMTLSLNLDEKHKSPQVMKFVIDDINKA